MMVDRTKILVRLIAIVTAVACGILVITFLLTRTNRKRFSSETISSAHSLRAFNARKLNANADTTLTNLNAQQHAWNSSQALSVFSTQYQTLVRSVENGNSIIVNSGLVRTPEVTNFLSSAEIFFRDGQSLLQLTNTIPWRRGEVHGAVHSNEVTGEMTFFTFSPQSGQIRSIQRRKGNGDGGEMLAFYPEEGIKAFLSPLTNEVAESVIGFYPNGVPEYLNVPIAPGQFIGAYFDRSGKVQRQKIRDASEMNSEDWRR